MYQKFSRALRKLHRGQRGMTGLETAIILIAFVTVASVLAYSVLSAGIFSAERGKETVYAGLAQAQSTLEVKGSVIGLSDTKSTLTAIEFTIALALPDEKVDSSAVVINYLDDDTDTQGVSANWTLAAGSSERGTAAFIENDEQFKVSLLIAANPGAYKTFIIELIPPKGATLKLKRTMPGALDYVMDLK